MNIIESEEKTGAFCISDIESEIEEYENKEEPEVKVYTRLVDLDYDLDRKANQEQEQTDSPKERKTTQGYELFDCAICTEESYEKRFVCPCGYKDVCMNCILRYYDTSEAIEMHCMICKKTWDRSILFPFMTKNLIKDIYDKQIKRLIKKEKGRIPQVQPIITLQIKKEELNSQLRTQMRFRGMKQREIWEYKDKEDKVKERQSRFDLLEINNNIEDLREEIRSIANELGENDPKKEKNKKKAFMYKCPKMDCSAFVSIKSGICDICKTKSCTKCWRLKVDENDKKHECNKDDIDSAKYIHSLTKLCPGCSTPIQKSQGCNQMWCTNCHTAFDWESLRIVTGNIHNPHALEYKRKNGNLIRTEVAGNACFNPDSILYKFRGCPREVENFIISTIALIGNLNEKSNHIQLRVPNYNNHIRKYLTCENQEKQCKTWSTSLKAAFTIHDKARENKQILAACSQILQDILAVAAESEDDSFDYSKLNKITAPYHIRKAVKDMNDSLMHVHEIYKGVFYAIILNERHHNIVTYNNLRTYHKDVRNN